MSPASAKTRNASGLSTTPAGRLERKLFHLLAGSSLPLLALATPKPVMLGLAVGLAAIAVTVEALRLRYPSLNGWLLKTFGALFKAREERRPTAATYMLVATAIAFAAFPYDVAILTLLMLSAGDPLAAMVGTRWGRPRLQGKSLEGTAAFLGVSVGLGLLLSVTVLDIGTATVLVGAVVATAAEALGGPVEDNLSVPLASGLAMALMEWMGRG
ncbi:MAG: hypothetical protein HYX97_05240 [Chloroflexi bacterium]|nr:hypothetical protein [Chloroflexota bacterium]